MVLVTTTEQMTACCPVEKCLRPVQTWAMSGAQTTLTVIPPSNRLDLSASIRPSVTSSAAVCLRVATRWFRLSIIRRPAYSTDATRSLRWAARAYRPMLLRATKLVFALIGGTTPMESVNTNASNPKYMKPAALQWSLLAISATIIGSYTTRTYSRA